MIDILSWLPVYPLVLLCVCVYCVDYVAVVSCHLVSSVFCQYSFSTFLLNITCSKDIRTWVCSTLSIRYLQWSHVGYIRWSLLATMTRNLDTCSHQSRRGRRSLVIWIRKHELGSVHYSSRQVCISILPYCSCHFCSFTTTTLRPLHRRPALASPPPQVRTGGFCCSKVLLTACPWLWQLAHSDDREDARVLNSVTTLSLYCHHFCSVVVCQTLVLLVCHDRDCNKDDWLHLIIIWQLHPAPLLAMPICC